MLHLRLPWRVAVTCLLVLTLPFCCCDVLAWIGAGAPCHDAVTRTNTEDCCDSYPDAGASGDHAAREGATPAPPCRGDRPGEPCPCGKDRLGAPTLEKAGIDPTDPTPLATLCVVVFHSPPCEARSAPFERIDRRGVPRPPTSLLRLHCALSV